MFPRRWKRALAAAEAAGFPLVLAPSAASRDGMRAARPAVLADELHDLVRRSDVAAVIASTGGWTTTSVLPHLDWSVLRAEGKPLIGYSDLSVLLWAAYAHGVPAIHGPMLISEFGHAGGPFPEDPAGLRLALRGRPYAFGQPRSWSPDDPWWDSEDDEPLRRRPATAWRVLKPGRVSAPVLAGNIQGVSLAMGTSHFPDTAGHVLMLEDLGIGPDQFAAHLGQWRLAGRLATSAGLLIGRRKPGPVAAGGFADFDAVVAEIAGEVPGPVVVDVDFGHTEPQATVPLGWTLDLDTDDPVLRFSPGPALRFPPGSTLRFSPGPAQ
jgi:muramoyltetrapeptide carboxypeptidase